MHIDELYRIYLAHPSIVTDTRKIKQGDIFLALKGPNFNGNDYAKAALDAGASYCIVDDNALYQHPNIIKVDDCLQSLHALALKHREQFNIPFLAITGSNGKTTTKELVHAVLSSAYRTYTTEGNLNNHIGVPLTILKIRKDAEFAVIEMGANHLHEIAGYCNYALPTHGLITNCGKAHLEGFGSEAGIRKAKGELYDHLRINGGTAFINWDYDYLREMSKGIPTLIKYGSDKEDIQYRGTLKESTELLSIEFFDGSETILVDTKLVGDYNFPNVMAAIAVGSTFNVPREKIIRSLEQYQPSNSRSQLISRNGNQVILDAYNANPSSMEAAIVNFSKRPGDGKVLVLGAMAELGEASQEEHYRIIKLLEQFAWDKVVLVGDDFRQDLNPFLHFNTVAEAGKWFNEQQYKNKQVLIKGSRSMQMEKLLE